MIAGRRKSGARAVARSRGRDRARILRGRSLALCRPLLLLLDVSPLSLGALLLASLLPPLGEALVLADGAWQIAGSLNLEKTKHLLKFELANDSGKIIANYSLPLTSRDLAKGQNGTPLVVVNKGDALWRIAYRRFGDGIRYVDIVRRNQRDIVDPDLIYPKQIFAVPRSAKDKTNQN